jgi:hypothetical protein
MGGINVSRWLLGGVVAALVIWLIEGAASALYMAEMQEALKAHDLSFDMGAGTMALTILVSLLAGLTLVFLYAASRTRFGPGPRTAVIAALALWVGGYVISILGYRMLDIFPGAMLVQWAVVGLVELILASLAGGWLYRES